MSVSVACGHASSEDDGTEGESHWQSAKNALSYRYLILLEISIGNLVMNVQLAADFLFILAANATGEAVPFAGTIRLLSPIGTSSVTWRAHFGLQVGLFGNPRLSADVPAVMQFNGLGIPIRDLHRLTTVRTAPAHQHSAGFVRPASAKIKI